MEEAEYSDMGFKKMRQFWRLTATFGLRGAFYRFAGIPMASIIE